MAGGRPTDDPKESLVAVRLSDRQLVVLRRRAKRDDINLSEAIRRCIDEWAANPPPGPRPNPSAPRTRPPRDAERATFKQLFSLFEDKPARRRPRRGM